MDDKGSQHESLKVAIAGASGFLGTGLSQALSKKGYEVIRLVRERSDKPGEVFWDPNLKHIDAPALEGVDIVINLAGKNISSDRWTTKVKTELRESRIVSTQLLSSALSKLKKTPRLFLSASGIGFYGDRGEEVLDESSKPGTGFFAQLCREWELATWSAEAIGMRVNHLRTGIVLGKKGGAFSKMARPFRFGLGARMGDGKQFMSWISQEDFNAAIIFLIETPQPSGPVNLVAANPVTNESFTKALASAVQRPTFLKLSDKMIKRLFGEMGTTLFLESLRVQPKRLLETGFKFADTEIKSALEKCVK